MKARSPKKFMGVSDAICGFLSNCMMIIAKNTLVKERIWFNRVAGQFVFQPFIQTGQRNCISAFASGH